MEFQRFLVNTTVGVLGFGDPAKDKHWMMPPADEDMGQSLAKFGMGNGFYIVWPILGPSTLRDSLGKVGDAFLDPVFYINPTEVSTGIRAVQFTNKSSFHLGEYETFKDSSINPYIALRDVYLQYRRNQIEE